MKKTILLKYIALTMALLMFTTSAGIAMDLHYCGGELQNLSLFSSAKSCHETPKVKKSCGHCDKSEVHREKMDCCDYEAVYLQFDQDYAIQSNISIGTKEMQTTTPASIQLPAITDNFYFVQYYKNYKPPLLDRDICIDIQSFLL